MQQNLKYAVEVKSVSKRYPLFKNARHRLLKTLFGSWFKSDSSSDFWALRDVSFSIPKGIAFGVIGRNGAGKSTLLQILAGTLKASSGEVVVNGRVNALLELGSGFNPEFSGRENVYLNGMILGFSKKQIDLKFDEIVEFSEIANFIDQPVKTYSSGMFVKLAFSVQCCLEPEVLIVDEALSVGDIFFVQKCHERIEKLISGGTTVLMVTHDLGVVERYCRETLILKNGQVHFIGETSKAISLYYADGKPRDEFSLDSEEFNRETLSLVGFDLSSAEVIIPDDSIEIISADIVTELYDSRRSFEMGSSAVIVFYVKFRKEIQNPIFTVYINSKTNLNVHTKSSLQFGLEKRNVKAGDVLRVQRRICLDLMSGEYSLTIGVSTLPSEFYDSAGSFSNDELQREFVFGKRLKVGSFSVTNPIRGMLPFYGVADLDGHMEIESVY